MIKTKHVSGQPNLFNLLLLVLLHLERPLLDRFLCQVQLTELMRHVCSLLSNLLLFLVFRIVFEAVNHVPEVSLVVGVDPVSALRVDLLNILRHCLLEHLLVVTACGLSHLLEILHSRVCKRALFSSLIWEFNAFVMLLIFINCIILSLLRHRIESNVLPSFFCIYKVVIHLL